MKENAIAPTQNVNKAIQCVNYLLNRPKTEMVGLGLIYGVPGVGKTRFARRFAIQNDFIYIDLDSTTTARSFALQLLERLNTKYNISEKVKGSTNCIFRKSVDIINDVEDDVIIFVDEIDYAFKDQKLLGEIRDVVDKTLAIIIMVGMEEAKRKLLAANAHYFDRCNYFVDFRRLKYPDVKLVCDTISDVKLDKETIEKIHTITKGTLRQVIKLINAIEFKAKTDKVKSMSYSEVKGVLSVASNQKDF